MSAYKNKYHGTKEYLRVYMELLNAAKYRGTFTYQEIAKIMGIPPQGSHMAQVTGQVLGEISQEELSQGRPMLSALAVGVKGFPGGGFFDLARESGRLAADQDEQEFWEKECQAVYHCWKVE